MSQLRIFPTKTTPEVILNSEGYIKIKGRSMDANVDEFTRQIEVWTENYIKDPADLTGVDFYLEYLSTSNINFYISLLRQVASTRLQNKKLIINWYYEDGDVDIQEKGEHISSVLNIPFNFKKITDNESIN